MFQIAGERKIDRKEHVWYRLDGGGGWKCCLCGAVSKKRPPDPIPAGWLPDRYEELTDAERGLVPYRGRGA